MLILETNKKLRFQMNSKKLVPVILIIGLSAFTFFSKPGKTVKVEEFKKSIDSIGLQFSMPPDYKETRVVDNPDIWYSFAIKNQKEDFEIRYSIWSLKPTLAEFEKCKLDSNCTMISPNALYKGRIQANVLNMTGGANPNIGAFPTQAVKKEFNADAGGSSFFEFNCAFGKGYKYGQMVYLHKDNIADVIITYMSNNKKKHPQLMEKAFHALRFK